MKDASRRDFSIDDEEPRERQRGEFSSPASSSHPLTEGNLQETHVASESPSVSSSSSGHSTSITAANLDETSQHHVGNSLGQLSSGHQSSINGQSSPGARSRRSSPNRPILRVGVSWRGGKDEMTFQPKVENEEEETGFLFSDGEWKYFEITLEKYRFSQETTFLLPEVWILPYPPVEGHSAENAGSPSSPVRVPAFEAKAALQAPRAFNVSSWGFHLPSVSESDG